MISETEMLKSKKNNSEVVNEYLSKTKAKSNTNNKYVALEEQLLGTPATPDDSSNDDAERISRTLNAEHK